MTHRLTSLYTPLEDAVAELHTRQREHTKPSSCEFERILSSRPCAVLSRWVATPNFELGRFVSLAASVGLTPLVAEFYSDTFTSHNPIKRALARLRFSNGFGRCGGPRSSLLTVADATSRNKSRLHELRTVWGQPLVSFHHELLALQPAYSPVVTADFSEWYRVHGGSARHYYAHFFGLFVRHAVLFDSYLLTGDEQRFTSEVVIPAFHAAFSRHGHRPLICRLDPTESEGHEHWLQYPHALREFVAERLSSTSTSLRNEPNA